MIRRACLAIFITAFIVAQPGAAQQAPTQKPQQPPQQPAFRTGVIVVPIDVRVVDNKTGKAVTDLKAEDFTLFEDGTPQPIRVFEAHTLTAGQAPPPGTKIPIRESAFGSVPQNNRVFLLVLGRGKLQEPSKALDALLRFVRLSLLPQDQLAVFAYDRATDFTTDHEAIAKLIERFKTVHYDIDMEVRLQVENGLAALYGSGALPKKVQDKIDNMFQGAGTLAYREVGRGATPATDRAAADSKRAAGDLQRADVNAKMTAANDQMNKDLGTNVPGPEWTTIDEVTSQMFSNLSFDDFMQANFHVDVVVQVLEALDEARDGLVVGREVGGAIVGEHRHLVLRQELRAHEADDGIHRLRGFLQASAPEHDEEDAVAVRGDANRRLANDWSARLCRLGLRRQHAAFEVSNRLHDIVLDEREVFLLEIGDRLARLVVHHADVNRHRGDAGAKCRLLLFGGLLCLRCLCGHARNAGKRNTRNQDEDRGQRRAP